MLRSIIVGAITAFILKDWFVIIIIIIDRTQMDGPGRRK